MLLPFSTYSRYMYFVLKYIYLSFQPRPLVCKFIFFGKAYRISSRACRRLLIRFTPSFTHSPSFSLNIFIFWELCSQISKGVGWERRSSVINDRMLYFVIQLWSVCSLSPYRPDKWVIVSVSVSLLLNWQQTARRQQCFLAWPLCNFLLYYLSSANNCSLFSSLRNFITVD